MARERLVVREREPALRPGVGSAIRKWGGRAVGALQEMLSFLATAAGMLTEVLSAFGETGSTHRLGHPWHSRLFPGPESNVKRVLLP